MFKNLRPIIKFKEADSPQVLEPQLSAYLTAQLISAAIVGKRPCLASRLGFTEARCLSQPDALQEPSRFVMDLIWKHSGVFPPEKADFQKFGRRYLEALSVVDLLGLIRNPAEKKLVDNHASTVYTCALGDLEPFLHPYPWSKHLAGLKVVVVHPFVESIRQQYEQRRSSLFFNPDVLPEFSLRVVKAPQSLAGNTDGYRSWTDACEHLIEEVLSQEFDVAILGCGAYGMPVGAHVKKIGKVAIHMGGATQLLFGVSGKRWRDQPAFRAIMTDAWRPPLEIERPPGWETIEDGCYW